MRVARQVSAHKTVIVIIDLIFLFRPPLLIIGHYGDHRDIFPYRRHDFGQAADPVGPVSLEGEDRNFGRPILAPRAAPSAKPQLPQLKAARCCRTSVNFRYALHREELLPMPVVTMEPGRDGPGQLP